jgi:formamidopyrimidine-DNA glycosylase
MTRVLDDRWHQRVIAPTIINMPELPEAETIARKIAAQLAGQKFAQLVHIRADIVRDGDRRPPEWLTGSAIERVGRRGKRPIIFLDGGRGIVFYLGMTGRVGVYAAGAAAGKHVHLRIRLGGGDKELRFEDYRRFGRVSFFEQSDRTEPPAVADLGIEPLEMKRRQFRAVLGRRRQIKALLMDQSVIAGLGNIYCDEALHRAGIHPLETAAEIDEIRATELLRSIKQVLRAAIRAEGSTVINYQHPDGPGNFQRRLRVYGHEGKPCRTCGTPIARVMVAGRSTHVCPYCQPAPRGGGG